MDNEAAPTCVICKHNNLSVDGYCKEQVAICSDGYHGTRECGCKCVFPAAPTATERPSDEKVAELFAWLNDLDARMKKHVTQWNFGDPKPLPISVNDVGRLVRELRTRLTAREPAAERWRDIASAPKDGTKILAYPVFGSVEVVKWWRSDIHKDGGSFINGNMAVRPTLWQPLPAGPQENQEDRQ